jgi:hypothetical protein
LLETLNAVPLVTPVAVKVLVPSVYIIVNGLGLEPLERVKVSVPVPPKQTVFPVKLEVCGMGFIVVVAVLTVKPLVLTQPLLSVTLVIVYIVKPVPGCVETKNGVPEVTPVVVCVPVPLLYDTLKGPVPLLIVRVNVTLPEHELETEAAETCGNGLMVISIGADVAFVHPSEFTIL